MKNFIQFILFVFLAMPLGSIGLLYSGGRSSLQAPIVNTATIQARYAKKVVSWASFSSRLKRFAELSEQELCDPGLWLEGKAPFDPDFFSITSPISFKPFAQKMVLSANSKIAFFGDLHGNYDSLLNVLQYLVDNQSMDLNLRIMQDNFYMVFLGDYVDRGVDGVEVIDMLMRLKLTNPSRVFLVRGNHEDADLNHHYGFKQELQLKFPFMTVEQCNQVYKIYDFMPPILCIGCPEGINTNFVYCCHGGVELGCNVKELLSSPEHYQFQAIKRLDRISGIRLLPSALKQILLQHIPASEIIDAVPITPTQPTPFGAMWNDFMTDDQVIAYVKGRGWKCGKLLTSFFCKNNSSAQALLRGIFRAHQHSGEMLALLQKNKGIVSLWDGMVHTFLAVPIQGLSFPYQSLGILTLADRYEEWSLAHHSIAS